MNVYFNIMVLVRTWYYNFNKILLKMILLSIKQQREKLKVFFNILNECFPNIKSAFVPAKACLYTEIIKLVDNCLFEFDSDFLHKTIIGLCKCPINIFQIRLKKVLVKLNKEENEFFINLKKEFLSHEKYESFRTFAFKDYVNGNYNFPNVNTVLMLDLSEFPNTSVNICVESTSGVIYWLNTQRVMPTPEERVPILQSVIKKIKEKLKSSKKCNLTTFIIVHLDNDDGNVSDSFRKLSEQTTPGYVIQSLSKKKLGNALAESSLNNFKRCYIGSTIIFEDGISKVPSQLTLEELKLVGLYIQEYLNTKKRCNLVKGLKVKLSHFDIFCAMLEMPHLSIKKLDNDQSYQDITNRYKKIGVTNRILQEKLNGLYKEVGSYGFIPPFKFDCTLKEALHINLDFINLLENRLYSKLYLVDILLQLKCSSLEEVEVSICEKLKLEEFHINIDMNLQKIMYMNVLKRISKVKENPDKFYKDYHDIYDKRVFEEKDWFNYLHPKSRKYGFKMIFKKKKQYIYPKEKSINYLEEKQSYLKDRLLFYNDLVLILNFIKSKANKNLNKKSSELYVTTYSISHILQYFFGMSFEDLRFISMDHLEAICKGKDLIINDSEGYLKIKYNSSWEKLIYLLNNYVISLRGLGFKKGDKIFPYVDKSFIDTSLKQIKGALPNFKVYDKVNFPNNYKKNYSIKAFFSSLESITEMGEIIPLIINLTKVGINKESVLLNEFSEQNLLKASIYSLKANSVNQISELDFNYFVYKNNLINTAILDKK